MELVLSFYLSVGSRSSGLLSSTLFSFVHKTLELKINKETAELNYSTDQMDK